MSDLYEVAFSGEIAPGAELQQVKAGVGKMFKADEAKLAQLFSGKRIVIKKNIDEQTALKYQAAMQKAGAICELVRVSAGEDASAPSPSSPVTSFPAEAPAAETASPPPAVARDDLSDRDIPPAPQTVPLQVSAEQIHELAADLAPVGSDMQQLEQPDVPPPSVPEGISVAPVGADLGDHKPADEPPPPDTSGLSLVDD